MNAVVFFAFVLNPPVLETPARLSAMNLLPDPTSLLPIRLELFYFSFDPPFWPELFLQERVENLIHFSNSYGFLNEVQNHVSGATNFRSTRKKWATTPVLERLPWPIMLDNT